MPENVKSSDSSLVCIVDDDASIADSTRYLVRAFGFRAEAFSSAEEFLNSSLAEETNCLILDARMPGMDGLELHRYLAKAETRIPIVFVTAQMSDNERKQALVSCPRNTRYFAGGQLAVFQGASEAPISLSYGSSEQRGKTANWPRSRGLR